MQTNHKWEFPEIPDFNSQQYGSLIDILTNGTCIFLGAGTSNLAGLKSWHSLKVAMIDYFWQKRQDISTEKRMTFDLSFCQSLQKHADPVEAFDYLYSICSEMFISGIREIFENDERHISNTIYQKLSKLNNGNNFFVTTNFDMGFQKYLGINDDNVSIYPVLSNPPRSLNYLHGRIDLPHTWIFTTEQYNSGYMEKGSGAPCKDFLMEIFRKCSVVFVGYGLREKEITQAISQTDKRKEHYWLEPFSRNRQDSLVIRGTSLRENYNITLVPYSVDRLGYEAVYEVIDAMHKTISKKARGDV